MVATLAEDMDSQESAPADVDKEPETSISVRRRKVVECAKETLENGLNINHLDYLTAY